MLVCACARHAVTTKLGVTQKRTQFKQPYIIVFQYQARPSSLFYATPSKGIYNNELEPI